MFVHTGINRPPASHTTTSPHNYSVALLITLSVCCIIISTKTRNNYLFRSTMYLYIIHKSLLLVLLLLNRHTQQLDHNNNITKQNSSQTPTPIYIMTSLRDLHNFYVFPPNCSKTSSCIPPLLLIFYSIHIILLQ